MKALSERKNKGTGFPKGSTEPVCCPLVQRFKDMTASTPRNLLKRSGFILIMLVCGFLILMPFLPLIPFYVSEMLGYHTFRPSDFIQQDYPITDETEPGYEDTIPTVNTLRLPAIGIDVPIVEGSNDSALNRGAWHRPGTGTPEEGGNMVVTGHRFKYLPPSNLTFYHLDKVEVGDWVIVYWNGKRYDYSVDRIFVVNPDQIEVEEATVEPQLTLYTCTPLWTAKQRLVVVAKPVAVENDVEEIENSADGDVDLEKLDDNLIDE